MTLWFFRLTVVIMSPIIGWYKVSSDWKGILAGVAAALFVIGVEIFMEHVPLSHLLYGALGGGLGFIFAVLVNEVVLRLNEPQLTFWMEKAAPYVYIVLTYLGAVIAVRRQDEVEAMDRGEVPMRGSKRRAQEMKVIDTSAIIDGRVADVFETKFLTGPLIVGRFVLKELQDIADSSDTMKRARGRRGLEILQRLQEHPDIMMKVYEKDYPEVKDTDGKLVLLARELNGKIITTDFNLNKVASLQGVSVLNVNDLANALKPAVLPGEGMVIYIAKEGKEKEQGVGYLDDGTMVVVEEGRRLVGKKVDVMVTSVLQTSAGRMIFTKIKEKNDPFDSRSALAQGYGERSRTMKDTAAIIVAGGKGLRYGGRVRKQYLLLKGRPLVWWSLSAFERSPSLSAVVLVVPAKDVELIRKQARSWKLKKLIAVVAGGSTRAASVREGLSRVPPGCRYVAVHDAVRPLTQPALIEAVIQAARQSGAALAACPSKDTVKLANARGMVVSSPPRDAVWLAQTPQIFERGILERAHEKGQRLAVTDDAQLVERLGVRVKLVESPSDNIKVTVPADLEIARMFIKGRE